MFFPFSQKDYFQTVQIALLIICATFVDPITLEVVNISFSFLSDDASHSSVNIKQTNTINNK